MDWKELARVLTRPGVGSPVGLKAVLRELEKQGYVLNTASLVSVLYPSTWLNGIGSTLGAYLVPSFLQNPAEDDNHDTYIHVASLRVLLLCFISIHL